MTASRGDSQPEGHSRRSFLGKLSLGLAGLAGAAFLARRLFFFGGKRSPGADADFPGEDSIFHPRKDVLERRRRG